MNWEYIPDVVKPYFVKRVCFYGAESTGKSTMAKRMAAHYNTEYVPEVAREMITSNNFSVDDIIAIGKAQVERIVQKGRSANRILFCDTDIITTQIYAQHYLHGVPQILYQLEQQVGYDIYFLFDIDVPWVEDGLRDLGHRRNEMATIFRSALDSRKISYVQVYGNWEQRFEIIKAEIDFLLERG